MSFCASRQSLHSTGELDRRTDVGRSERRRSSQLRKGRCHDPLPIESLCTGLAVSRAPGPPSEWASDPYRSVGNGEQAGRREVDRCAEIESSRKQREKESDCGLSSGTVTEVEAEQCGRSACVCVVGVSTQECHFDSL